MPLELDARERPIAGRYAIEEVLGRGGMGAVYSVLDTRTGERLALKRGFARDPRKAEKRQALLEREYHTLAQLAHPSIIEVYDYGVDDEGPYYTMELLDGEDLDKRGKLPWQEACVLLCDVASSLAMLHSRRLLHRDVSARNVRCTADGRAKLIDFGAMTGIGVAKEVLGTPPFVAPEALQMQALDPRADLYSIGALAYYLFTGRHAYPVRRLSELRDAWRSGPMDPSRFANELPKSLDQLVRQLLCLDRNGRPQSAAEVMERLCTIAGLPIGERAEVSQAYLSAPALVGREKALLSIRRRMLALMRGEGATLAIAGVAGSGRSRLLDNCVLEGKLVGATVARADAGDGAAGEWGVARALGAQLLEQLPEDAIEAARLSRNVVGQVIDGLRGDAWSMQLKPERSLLLRELRDFFLALSRQHRLLLVIDDIDQIDEPSAALLAGLSHKTERHPLMLALAVDYESEGAGRASITLLRSVAATIVLEQLDDEQTEALMRSVFGDVANLRLVAGRIHALSEGSPRAAMELAQHLIDRNLAHYEAGSWSLPAELDEDDLPDSLTAALQARLRSLSADARELLDVLCLADGDRLALADYPALTEHGDRGRVYRALHELVLARVLYADAEHYRVSQRGFLTVLQEDMPKHRCALVHERLFTFLDTRGGSLERRAHHLLYAGREREAIALLGRRELHTKLPALPLLERALAASQRLSLPARVVHDLRNLVLAKASMVAASASFRRELPEVLLQLKRDSGLSDYEALANAAPAERLSQALTRAQQRYEQTPLAERVSAPLDALRELGRLSTNVCAIALQLYDLALLQGLPKLSPFVSLSPALVVIEEFVAASTHALRGQTLLSQQVYERVLRRLAEPDRAGLDDQYHRGVRLGTHYLLGLTRAAMGDASAENHALILENDREHRVNAWRVRVALFLNQGNVEEARRCERRAEILQLQEGDEQRYIGSSTGFELLAHALTGDLLGVKHLLDAVSTLAEHHDGWKPGRALGQCHYRWLQGDLTGALEMALFGLSLGQPGKHPYFCYLAAAHIGLLTELGRLPEAVIHGRQYLADCRIERQAPLDRWVEHALATTLAQSGAHDEAVSLIDQAVASAEGMGIGGLSLAVAYETKARIAIATRDRATFETFAERSAIEYRKSRNLVLGARIVRLLDEGRKLDPDPSLPPCVSQPPLPPTETGFETVQSRMLECVDRSDRARCALLILLESMGCKAGYLYGVGDRASLDALAALPNEPASEGLRRWLEAALLAELESDLSATASVEGEESKSQSSLPARFTDAQSRCYEPIFLTTAKTQNRRIAAMLALEVKAGPRTVAPKELLAEIANQLLEHGDVVGMVV